MDGDGSCLYCLFENGCEERTLRANVVLATFHGQHQGQDLPDQCLLSKSHLECFALKSSLVLQHVILNYRKCIDIDDVYIYIYTYDLD